MDWNEILKSLGESLQEYLQGEVSEHLAEAAYDVEEFLNGSRDLLQHWTAALIEKQLTSDEYVSLVRGQVALSKMKALETAGLTQIRIDRIRAGILDRILDVVFRARV